MDMASDDDQLFAERMRRLRENKQWSQGVFAQTLQEAGLEHFHQTTVSRIEKGERPVRLNEARVIARVLDTTVDLMTAPTDEGHEFQRLANEYRRLAILSQQLREAAEGFLVVHADLERLHKRVSSLGFEDWSDAEVVSRIQRLVSEVDVMLERGIQRDAVEALLRVKGGPDGLDPEAP